MKKKPILFNVMKKKHFIFTACLLAGCVGGIYGGMTKSASNESSLTMENVEALTDNEDGVVILCNKGYDGRCFRKGYNLKMCQENTYYECEYTGYTNDYCKNPC